jgi:hypothetical protein
MPTIAIEFNLSKSQSGEQVLYEVAGLTAVRQKTDGKTTTFRLRLAKDKIRHAFGLLKSLKRLKNKRILVDGTEVDYNTAFGFLPCYQKKLQLGSHQYCFGGNEEYEFSQHNIFGCVHASFFEFGSQKHGTWDKKKRQWRFNKRLIRKALEKELQSYRCCPAFDERRIDRIIKAIPFGVNPFEDPDWQFIPLQLHESPSTARCIPVKNGNGITYFIKGVTMSGEGGIKKIAKKAGVKPFTKGLEWVSIRVNLLEDDE